MYTNNKEQVSLEEAYRKVHLTESCCDSCEHGEACECDETSEVPSSVEDAIETGKDIVYQGDDAGSELRKFLPLVFAGAASSLGANEMEAKSIADKLVSRLNVSEVESRISDLHAEKERLTDEAKHSMEAQVKLNKVIDKLLKYGTLEALDVLYHNPENNVPPSKIVKALEAEIEKRISSRK